MNNLKWLVILFTLALFFLSYETKSWAELRIGRSLSVREEYNDNIFLTASDEEEDFITTLNPALNISYNIKILTFSLDYGLHFRFYAHHTELNETGLSQSQRANLETTVSPYKDIFYIKIADEYKRVPVDERRQVALDNFFVNMSDSNRFFINPYIQYPLSRTLRTRIDYSYENIWYREEEGNNSKDHTAKVSLTKELSPRIVTSLSYASKWYRPENTENYDRQDAMLDIGYQVSQILSLSGEIGKSWLDYEKSMDISTTTWNIQATSTPTPRLSLSGSVGEYLIAYEKVNFKTMLRNIQAKYLIAKSVSLGAGYSESVSDSITVGTYKQESTTGTIDYTGKIGVNLGIFKKINTYTAVEREDRLTGVSLGSSIPITPNITGRLTGIYTNYRFLPGDEKGKRYGLGFSLDYPFWITTASLGYTYNRNNSSINNNDYKNNIIWLQARFVF